MIKNEPSGQAYSEIISYYDNDAAALSRRYEKLTFEIVHSDILRYLPKPPGRAIDIGAGSGRDSEALRKLGFDVTAVEPSQKMRELAKHQRADDNIRWVDDTLPHLRRVDRRLQFVLVLVSAVWMHLRRQDQKQAMQTVFDLTAPGGRAFISFRHASPHDKTTIYATKIEQVRDDAVECGFTILQCSTTEDLLGRPGTTWHSLILEK